VFYVPKQRNRSDQWTTKAPFIRLKMSMREWYNGKSFENSFVCVITWWLRGNAPAMKGLLSKQTVVLRRWEGETGEIGIKQVEKSQISTVKWWRSWCFERWGPFLEIPEKPLVKLRPAYSVKLVFSYVVKGIKIKITAKFPASKRLRFEDTKRISPSKMRPKSFGTFEKRAPGSNFHTSLFPDAASQFSSKPLNVSVFTTLRSVHGLLKVDMIHHDFAISLTRRSKSF